MVLMSSLRRLSCASRVSLAFACSLSAFVFADGALSSLEAFGALSDLFDDGVVSFWSLTFVPFLRASFKVLPAGVRSNSSLSVVSSSMSRFL